MKRSDWLNLAQGMLCGLQFINAGLATLQAPPVAVLLCGGSLATLSYIVHSFAMDTEPPK